MAKQETKRSAIASGPGLRGSAAERAKMSRLPTDGKAGSSTHPPCRR